MKLNNRFIIIIPLYNAKDLIESCLMSILTQTYDDLGIIIKNSYEQSIWFYRYNFASNVCWFYNLTSQKYFR